MSYIRAEEILPKELIETIQQYVSGKSSTMRQETLKYVKNIGMGWQSQGLRKSTPYQKRASKES